MIRHYNFDKYTGFRKKFQIFSFDGYDFQVNGQELTVEFHFSIDNLIFFKPQTKFVINSHIINSNPEDLKILLFHIGMVELISYWKAVCPQKVVIKPFQLSQDQIKWWKKLWFNGLGEFFWLNSISATEEDFLHIENASDIPFAKVNFNTAGNEVIVPIGGGKDSAVSAELLLNIGASVRPMLVNPRDAMTQTVNAAGISEDKSFVIHRTIDPELIRLNSEGYLNGHTPFSSLLAFQSLIPAYFSGISDIALSNESSANEATVPGTNINHQYSKSFEFERDFRQYAQTWLNSKFNYFSLLRPLSELQIAYIFSKLTAHHPHFRSCNAGSKSNIWCGKCPKCLFTAIILLPFVGPDAIMEIFGDDLFSNQDLFPIFRQLTGMDSIKPFECVGTPSEINLALSYSIDYHFNGKELPFLIDFFKKSEKYYSIEKNHFFLSIYQNFDTQHFLSDSMYEQLKKYIRTV